MKSSLNDNFCSSPWFHIRVSPNGDLSRCRWEGTDKKVEAHNIANTSMIEYMNSNSMSELRTAMLSGEAHEVCKECRYEESHNKVSGRQRQLLKSGIRLDNFDKTFCSSPHWEQFVYSNENQGRSTNLPVDLQIDLGNTCNSACIMCAPPYSSRLAADFIKLHVIEPTLFKEYNLSANWSDNTTLVNKFVSELSDNPHIKYIHFIGGETLYLRGFYAICNQLISNGLSQTITIGTTTNCTIFTPELTNIIHNFKHVHLGLSIESFHPINDYVRWPSDINAVKININKFLDLRKQTGANLSLRITPNLFTIYHIDTIFEFMIENNIIAESCNILRYPSCLRVELLPKEIIKTVLIKIDAVIEKYALTKSNQAIINRRSDMLVDTVISEVIFEYKYLLETCQLPDDYEQERYNLVKYIRAFEQIRNNKILDYLPEYEEFLRSYGY